MTVHATKSPVPIVRQGMQTSIPVPPDERCRHIPLVNTVMRTGDGRLLAKCSLCKSGYEVK